MNKKTIAKWKVAFVENKIKVKCSTYAEKMAALLLISEIVEMPVNPSTMAAVIANKELRDYPYVGVFSTVRTVAGFGSPGWGADNVEITYTSFVKELAEEKCSFSKSSQTHPTDNLPVVEFWYGDVVRRVKLQELDEMYLKGLEMKWDGSYQYRTFRQDRVSGLQLVSYKPNTHKKD